MSEDPAEIRTGTPEERTAQAGGAVPVFDRIRRRLPQGTVGRRLAVMALLDAAGTGLFLSVSTLFLTGSVGLSVGQVGVGLSAAAGAGLVATMPVAILADRYGTRRLLTVVILWRAACLSVYPFVPDFATFLALVVLMGLVEKTMAPLVQSLVGMAVPESERVHTMAVMGALRNVGYTAGALLGSVALVLDDRAAYTSLILANALSFVVLAAVARGIPLLPESADAVTQLRRRLSVQVFSDRPFLVISALNIVLAMHVTLLSVGIPVWVASATRAPRSVVSVLLVINTVLAALFQVRVSRDAEDLGRASRLMRTGGLGLAAACVLLAAVPSLPTVPAVALLVLSVVAMTAGELYQSAGGWGISYKLAREGQESAYVSMFWLSVGAQQIIAPLVIALMVDGGALAWTALATVQAAAGLAVPAATRWAAREKGLVCRP
ncbi:MFS transporter [Streptomyces sp. NPDC048720]|uniref:MFS transporter n=1 Tax=Streptomyces sp. NPDC048720 TaxID=3365588 RepID=UPI00371A869C